MAAPTWSVGQVLTASDVNTWFVPLAAVRTSNSAQNKTTTGVADGTLVLPMAANAYYEFRLNLWAASASTTSSFKFQLTVPSGTTGTMAGLLDGASGGTFTGGLSLTVTVTAVVGGTANANYPARMTGVIQTAGTAGNLGLLYAENVLDAANGAYILAQSALVLTRIG